MTMGGKNFMKFNCLFIFLSFMRSIKPNCMYVWYFVTKIVLTYCEKKKDHKQFIQAVKAQNNFW